MDIVLSIAIAEVICKCTNSLFTELGILNCLTIFFKVNLNPISTLLLHDHTKPNFPTAMCAVHATPIFKIETCCFLQYTDALLMQPSR